ncbi:MAG TPA: DNA helicase RecQ [Luteibaculaceae bacterium]|nr:DNA helicase RecQ [Luteibaculaceae bacterium]
MIDKATLTPTEALQKYFGFNTFKGDQEAIIQSILDGRDTFVIMPTGGGKSLCYQLPALMMDGIAIVVSPLIALMKNQVDAIRGFSDDDSVAHVLNSSLTKTETNRVKQDIIDGKTKLLYVAPESLNKGETVDFLRSVKISFFAIDEAHCISEWGHDFRPEYRRLRPIINEIGQMPIIALTATATPKVQSDIQKTLGMVDANFFKASFNRPNLYYEVRQKQQVEKQIIRYIKQHEGKSGIIYCLSRKKVEELAQTLMINGVKALPYHAGLDANTRAKTQDAFLMEECDVIVATIAFGMGIDKPDVRYVIHHDIPKSLEGYYQETGRAGRDGGEGNCIVFYSYKDIEKLEKFLQGKPVAEIEIGRQLLSETVSFAETSMCRRKYILYYFGEGFDENQCSKMCDNCRNPKEKVEGMAEVHLLLKTIASLNEKHKAKYISGLLVGQETSEILTYKGDQNEFYGQGANHDINFWNAVLRQVTVKGLIYKEIESYGTLKLTDEGRRFIEQPESFMITLNHDYSLDDDDDSVSLSSGRGAADEQLLALLKDLRRSVAKQKNLPPYVIFQDPSLEDMAIQYPINLEELKKIVGVGEGKAKKFGQPFVELVRTYVEENGIERPDDLIVRTAPAKSGLRVHIIQGIDRKLPLSDIARAKGVTIDEVIEELEKIVASGTRVNIDYHIDEVVDEDVQDEIYDYFLESDTDNLEDCYNEFDGDYTEEEIKLVRIKFLSEVAN